MPASSERIILGINSAYHESAAAIVRGDQLVFAVEEERLTRVKHAKTSSVSNPDELPWQAIQASLDAVGLDSLSGCDAIGYSLMPNRRQATIGLDPYPINPEMGFGTANGEAEFNRRVLQVPELLAKRAQNHDVAKRVQFVAHHKAHAASSFLNAPFERAALLVIDGIGENSTACLGRGTPEGIELLEQIPYPHSIGMLWERFAVYLGFTEYDACKVMGLAAYGDPDRFRTSFDHLFKVNIDAEQPGSDNPPFVIDASVARFRSGDTSGLERLFGGRAQREELMSDPRFADVAAGLQARTELAVLTLCRRLACVTGESNLAYSGGVALNCLANARIEREGPFERMSVIGAAHDAGTAIGAAAQIAGSPIWQHKRERCDKLSPFLGPEYTNGEIDRALANSGYSFEVLPDCIEMAASLLVRGLIIGWFQGRLEFGPRALGNRSILVDPRNGQLRDRLNRCVKHRESFRPFGASVLDECAADWFEFPAGRDGAAQSRNLMLFAYRVRPAKAPLIPAAVHHDGTCRIQTVHRETQPLFHRLLTQFFQLTGVPVLLNTSFNDQEPIVASPADALSTFERTEIDGLFLQDRFVRRQSRPTSSRLS